MSDDFCSLEELAAERVAAGARKMDENWADWATLADPDSLDMNAAHTGVVAQVCGSEHDGLEMMDIDVFADGADARLASLGLLADGLISSALLNSAWRRAIAVRRQAASKIGVPCG